MATKWFKFHIKMDNSTDYHVKYPYFEGPLTLLLHLIQKEELSIFDTPLVDICLQLAQKMCDSSLNQKSDTLALIASLIYLKSKNLLPSLTHEKDTLVVEDFSSKESLLEHLSDYCQFKQIAKHLAEKEDQEQHFYTKGCLPTPTNPPKITFTPTVVSAQDLATLMQKILQKAPRRSRKSIEEDLWSIEHKIDWILTLLKEKKDYPFEKLFPNTYCRLELIVTFLALLELIKQNRLIVKVNPCITTSYLVNIAEGIYE